MVIYPCSIDGTEQRSIPFFARSGRTRLGSIAPCPTVLHDLYELMKWGPTANNSNPARILFLRSQEAKDRLIPALNEGNIAKVRAALVSAIIAYETRFYEDWGRFFPYDYSAGFVNDAAKADKTALRNSSLQAPISSSLRGHWDWRLEQCLDSRTKGSTGYFSLAQASNFLCNIRHGDPTALAPRAARYDFDEVCTIL